MAVGLHEFPNISEVDRIKIGFSEAGIKNA